MGPITATSFPPQQVKKRAIAARAKSQAAKDAAESLRQKAEEELKPAGGPNEKQA